MCGGGSFLDYVFAGNVKKNQFKKAPTVSLGSSLRCLVATKRIWRVQGVVQNCWGVLWPWKQLATMELRSFKLAPG